MAILSVLFTIMAIFAKSYLSNSIFIFLHLSNIDSITIYSLRCLKNAFFFLSLMTINHL